MNVREKHDPVLLQVVVEHLRWDFEHALVADLTVGGGGHLEALLAASKDPQKVWAFDQDSGTLQRTQTRMNNYPAIEWVNANFEEAPMIIAQPIDRILVDLGVSSFQLDNPSRGFSFRVEGPLDMRMDTRQKWAASDWLKEAREEELSKVFWEYGEDRQARLWARRLVTERKKRELRTTKDLVEILGFKLDSKDRTGRHPLTRVFQAVRMYVNRELEVLEQLLQALPGMLRPGARVGIITFHSLEDRLVKWSLRETLRPINKKVIVASEEEIRMNPRSRSAKLRVFEKQS